MAKKKKQTRRKKIEVKSTEASLFWPITWAVLLIIIAVLMLLGGFGTGGPMPKALFNGASWAFGWASWLVPVAFIFFSVHKFKSENRKVPLGKFFSMLGLLLFSAGWFHVTFAQQQGTVVTGGHGGAVGGAVGGVALSALSTVLASITFLIVATVLFMLSFSLPLRLLLAPFGMLRRPRNDGEADTDLAELKGKMADSGFRLKEGVPVEHEGGQEKDPPRTPAFKNTAQKLTPTEDHQALTIASDPNWQFPPLKLLDQRVDKANAGDVEGSAQLIKETFGNFGIDVVMEGATVGPTVTQYTMRPPANVKLTKITALENNLALNLAAHSLRMEAPIPGKRAVGIEVPNIKPAIVRIFALLQSGEWMKNKQRPLSFVVGRDINGNSVIADLADMPHVLIAGQTKSGKSVMINTLLTSLLYNNSPSDLKLIMVDPKVVELAPYNDIPHLLTPVISDPEKCISALKWAVAEMERRYRALAEAKTRNIEEYNTLKQEEGMPYIVIVIDELADLMMMAARDVEALIVRIAQKARAVGLHLVLATQRPSVDVITGLIKANIPARIAFAVSSQIDSRTIIDQVGAEKLLGKGDMLFLTTDMPKPRRIQGSFISTEETMRVTDFLRDQRAPQYDQEVVSQPVQLNGKGGVVSEFSGGGGSDAEEDMMRDAVRVVIEARKASTSLLQRRLRIGYGRAARLIETMEEQGIVGAADGSRPREVLISSMDEYYSATGGGGYDDDDAAPPSRPQGPRETFLVQ